MTYEDEDIILDLEKEIDERKPLGRELLRLLQIYAEEAEEQNKGISLKLGSFDEKDIMDILSRIAEFDGEYYRDIKISFVP